MAIPVKVEIIVGIGKTASRLQYYSFSIKQELFTHHSFEVTVPYEMLDTGENGFFNEAHKKYCGQPIEITVTQKPTQKDSQVYSLLEFKGIITNIALSNTNSTDGKTDFNHQFVLSGYSPTYLLEGGSQRRTFHDQSIGQIFKTVLAAYPNDLLRQIKTPDHCTKNLEYAVQYDESPYAFLQRLADEYGAWFYYDGQQLRLGLPDQPKAPQAKPSLKKSHRSKAPLNDRFLAESQLEFEVGASHQLDQSFDLAFDLQPHNFGLSHSDYQIPRRYTSLSEDQPLSQPSDFTAFALEKSDNLFAPAQLGTSRQVHEQAELDAAAWQRRGSWASRLVTFKGTGENTGFGVGKKVQVWSSHQAGKLHDYGDYRLTQVTHSVTLDMYSNKFEAVPGKAQHPPTNPLVRSPQGVPELATVFATDDLEKLGRIQVSYPWVVSSRNDALTGWIRVSTPYSGTTQGQLFTPEVGSQVLVGYEQGRPEFPVVLGNLYYRQPDKEYTSDKNNLKIIQTAGGNTISFDDKAGDERIILSNFKVNEATNDKSYAILELSFEEKGSILLSTNGSIDLNAEDAIRLNARQISLIATEILQLHSSKVVETTGESVEMRGTTSTKVTGKKTEVSSDTTTVVKGPLVRIN